MLEVDFGYRFYFFIVKVEIGILMYIVIFIYVGCVGEFYFFMVMFGYDIDNFGYCVIVIKWRSGFFYNFYVFYISWI